MSARELLKQQLAKRKVEEAQDIPKPKKSKASPLNPKPQSSPSKPMQLPALSASDQKVQDDEFALFEKSIDSIQSATIVTPQPIKEMKVIETPIDLDAADKDEAEREGESRDKDLEKTMMRLQKLKSKRSAIASGQKLPVAVKHASIMKCFAEDSD